MASQLRLSRGRFTAGAAAVLASINVTRGTARAAQFAYKFATDVAPEHPTNVRGKQIFDEIRQSTGGRLDISLFPNNMLGGATAQLTQLRSGAIQFMMALDGVVAGVVPVVAIAGVGFAFRDSLQAFAAFDGPLGAYVVKEIGAKGLFVHDQVFLNGMREITSSAKPITAVGDLAGMKIRTPPNKLALDLFKSMGAAPTPMNFNELYTALQTKVVDGQENPFAIIEVGKLYEVQKFLSVTNHMWSSEWLIGNADAWSALPPDVQKIAQAGFTKYAQLQRADTERLNETLAAQLAKQGMTINRVTDTAGFRARLGGFYARWKSEFGPTAWDLLEKGAGIKLG